MPRSFEKTRLERMWVTAYRSTIPIGTSLPELLEQLNKVLEEIPEECRADSVCDIEVESDPYDTGCHFAELEVAYYRPETEEEFAERLKEIEAFEKKEELRERRILESLKKKYEPN